MQRAQNCATGAWWTATGGVSAPQQAAHTSNECLTSRTRLTTVAFLVARHVGKRLARTQEAYKRSYISLAARTNRTQDRTLQHVGTTTFQGQKSARNARHISMVFALCIESTNTNRSAVTQRGAAAASKCWL
ncbi:hypothetical protein TRVL_09643 [Trypanosoma vivax]|nr:hypothetical protein TRVL_09643 [Trypanosoma vivax]